VRRVPVRFWKRGEAEPRQGYITNVSPSGVFVHSGNPFPRGTRVRLEVLDPDVGFVVEGLVAHALKAPPTLQQVKPSGMGIRFLQVQELVSRLFRGGQEQPADAGVEAETGPDAEAPHDGIYPLRFASPREFLETFRREVQWGGVFVPTRFPAAVNAAVTVEIHPPRPPGPPQPAGDGGEVIRLPARVVQATSAEAADGDGEAGEAGMGVVFTDLEAAIAALRPAVLRQV
jgi:hypothetical protein